MDGRVISKHQGERLDASHVRTQPHARTYNPPIPPTTHFHQDPAARLQVLQASTRRFALAPDVDLAAVVARCPPTFTGADFSAVASQVCVWAERGMVPWRCQVCTAVWGGGLQGFQRGTHR